MKKNYDYCIKELLKSEGGYSNDPSDSGGATNYGITIADYRMYIKKGGTPNDVKNMTVDQAKAIYKSKYWDAVNGDQLESGVDYSVFDYGVHSGVAKAKACLKKYPLLKGDKLIDAINDDRKAFLTRLINARPKDEKFRKGWMTRVDRVRKQSHYLASNPKTDNVTPVMAASVTGVSYFTMLQDWVWAHPYVATGIGAAFVILVGSIVHAIRNPR